MDKQFNILDGSLETNSADYKANIQSMQSLVEELNKTVGMIKEGSSILSFT